MGETDDGAPVTTTNPEQMRGEAEWLDGYADGVEGTSEDGATEPLRTAAATLRAAADQLEAVRAWLDGQDSAEWDVVNLEALDVILRGGDDD